jgi:hypothetical protein
LVDSIDDVFGEDRLDFTVDAKLENIRERSGSRRRSRADSKSERKAGNYTG